MDETSFKTALRAEADSINPGPTPTGAIVARTRASRVRVRAVIGGGAAVFAAAVALGLGTIGNGGSSQVPSANGSPKSSRVEPATPAGAPGPVVATSRTDAALKYYYPKVADLITSPAADAIVRGTVTKIEFQTVEGVASTVLTVDVKENLSGETPRTITVHEDGGYLPVSEVREELKAKGMAEAATDPNGYVDVRFEGADHPQIGDTVILVLMKDPNVGREGDYMEVSSVYGRFTLKDSGAFVRTGQEDGIETQVTLPEARELARPQR